MGHHLFSGGLSPDHRISNAVNALNFRRNGYVRIDQLLKRSSPTAVEAKAHRSYFDEAVHNGLEAGGFGVERHNGSRYCHETDHQAFLVDTFQYHASLFNEVCHRRTEPLLDIWEAIPTWETDLDAARPDAFRVMEYIWTSIPYLLQNLGIY